MKRSIKFFGLNFENFLFFQSLRVGKFFSKFFLKGSYLKDLNRILKDISSKGFVKINHYYSPEEIESLNKLVIKILDEHVNSPTDKFNIEKYSGFIKINSPLTQKYSQFKRISFDYVFLIISLFFYRRIKVPSAYVTIKHDGSFIHPIVPGEVDKTNEIIDPLWLPHIDSNKHLLKALILLDDISLENGPTGLISGSYRDKLFRNFYIKNYQKFSLKTNILDKPLIKKIENELIPSYLTGKKGDLIFVDTNNIHWASTLKKGCRKILWLHFS